MAALPNADITKALQEAGPTVKLWPTAAQALGIGRTSAFKLAKDGNFPVKVLRLGSSYRIVTADLKALLGLSETQELADSA
ncbi:hypothetical protein [Rhodococcus qingshengii]|uniref:hypothetical protein n=1 Tax=Rhodococcus qingshengii TaxID=334542 RepID=UPI0021AB9222|nr:hypothetical protein [Rhodococcus qingshengii]